MLYQRATTLYHTVPNRKPKGTNHTSSAVYVILAKRSEGLSLASSPLLGVTTVGFIENSSVSGSLALW